MQMANAKHTNLTKFTEYILMSNENAPPTKMTTVKTFYNVTRYNRIFNIRHKLLGTDLFPLKFTLYNRIFT